MGWKNDFNPQKKMLAGAAGLAHAVGRSMGPQGKNTIVDLAPGVPGTPTSTRDGVTIARNIYFEDPVMDAGSRLVRAAAERTVEEAGDGTSAATVLAHAFFKRGLELLEGGTFTPGWTIREVIDEITATATAAVTAVSTMVVTVSGEMIDSVAAISVNNDKVLGSQVAEAIRQSGAHGVVSVEDSGTAETEIERQEGMQFNSGYKSNGFVNRPEQQVCDFDDCHIFMFDGKLMSLQGMMPMLNGIEKSGRPIVILAEDIGGEALGSLLKAKLGGALQVCCVKIPGNLGHRKDLLLDIAALCGGKPILREMQENPADATPDHMGFARRVVVTRGSCRIVGGAGDPRVVKARVDEIYGLLKQEPPQIERERLQERLAKLAGGVTVLRLGAQTGLELGDKKMRVDDAINAIRCAIEEGVVPGAGTALLRASQQIGGEFAPVLEATFRQILANAGHSDRDIAGIKHDVLRMKDNWFGYNALTGTFSNLGKSGVLDPLKVVRQSLLNAASVAKQMLLTDTVVSLVR